MSNRPTGGPAFPVPGFEFLDDRDPTKPERVVNLPAPGMTLRDYFAAKAMTYIQSRYEDGEAEAIAREAYLIADALLAERGHSR